MGIGVVGYRMLCSKHEPSEGGNPVLELKEESDCPRLLVTFGENSKVKILNSWK